LTVSSPNLSGLVFLVVDDDDLDRMAIRRTLIASGEHVNILEACDAVSAIELINATKIDCVLLDYNMPGRDGLWLVSKARAQGIRVPMIVLTGQGDERTAVELMRAGATDYFSKSMLTTERVISSVRQSLRMVAVEMALGESEHRARLAIEAAELGMWDYYPADGRLELSERTKVYMGLSPNEEADYNQFLASVHPDDRTRVQVAVLRALQKDSGSPFDVEYQTITFADGCNYWLRATGRVLFDEQGRATRFIGTVQDIGERKQLDVQRSQLYEAERLARQQAEAASRMREDLVAIVSHDLRNPLSNIHMSAELLRMAISPEVVRMTKPVETILRSAARMKRLISDLLDVAALDGGVISLRHGRYEASELMAEAVEMFNAVAADGGLVLAWEPYDGSLAIRGDKDRVLQVFSNLLDNAIKFTPRGGTVTVSARAEAPVVHFTVADTGQGLSDDHRKHLFDRYWQAKRDGRLGVGLGLSIAKGIVEAHGGNIWAESELGQGTTFHFTLPQVEEPQVPDGMQN
jgi:PAS domain S-box-containing protein